MRANVYEFVLVNKTFSEVIEISELDPPVKALWNLQNAGRIVDEPGVSFKEAEELVQRVIGGMSDEQLELRSEHLAYMQRLERLHALIRTEIERSSKV